MMRVIIGGDGPPKKPVSHSGRLHLICNQDPKGLGGSNPSTGSLTYRCGVMVATYVLGTYAKSV